MNSIISLIYIVYSMYVCIVYVHLYEHTYVIAVSHITKKYTIAFVLITDECREQ